MPENESSTAAREITSLLIELVKTERAFAITNDSLTIVFEELGEKIANGLMDHPPAQVFASCHKQVVLLRAALDKQADLRSATRKDGRAVRLVNEDGGRAMVKICPPNPTW